MAIGLLARAGRRATKGYAGMDFVEALAGLRAKSVGPARKDELASNLHLAPIRQRIESIFWT